MEAKEGRKRGRPKDARAKLHPKERAKLRPPPIEREHLEEVMRRLLATKPPPKKKRAK